MLNEFPQSGLLKDRPQIQTNKKIRKAGKWEPQEEKNIFRARKLWYSQCLTQFAHSGTKVELRFEDSELFRP